MDQRVTIERDMVAIQDDWGQPGESNWRTHLMDLPCRLWYSAGREVIDGTKTAAIEDRRVIVPKETDVNVSDRIAKVTDRQGTLIYGGPMRIESVGRRQDHLELMLEAV